LDLFIMKNAPPLAWRLMCITISQAQTIFVPCGHLAQAGALGVSIALTAASFANSKVAVRLQGDILPACAITDSLTSGATLVSLALPDITRPGQMDYGFTVDCNAPFDYRLEAKYGMLTHVDESTTSGAFAKTVPYDVAIHIPTDGITINDRCSGESLRTGHVGCPFSNSGSGIALASKGKLTLAWAPKGILLAGKYTDKLTITLGVRR
jgi:hypothetical protein